MVINTDTTVAAIVSENPLAAQIFYKYGIDFCCQGGVDLDTACAKKEVEKETILEQLNALDQDETVFIPTNKSLSQIIGHILTHYHDVLKDELPVLQSLMSKVAQVHGQEHTHLLEMHKQLNLLATDISQHLLKEENILFPIMLEIERCQQPGQHYEGAHCGTVNNPMRQMEHEHDEAGTILKNLKELSNDYTLPAGACNSYRALYAGLEKFTIDLFNHIHLENNVLHPLAAKLELELS